MLLLAACASDEAPSGDRGPGDSHGPPHDPQDRGGPGPGGPQIFISPAGEPFRAGPGEPYPSKLWFDRADANHDGLLDRAEMRADAERFFRRLDTNHDGVIDSFEVSEYEQRVAPEILGAYRGGPDGPSRPGGAGRGERGGGGPQGRRGGPGPGGGRGGAPGSADLDGAALYAFTNDPEPVMAADLNLDGRITLKSFLQTVDHRFDRIDTAHTGVVAFASLPLTPLQQMALGKKGKRPKPRD